MKPLGRREYAILLVTLTLIVGITAGWSTSNRSVAATSMTMAMAAVPTNLDPAVYQGRSTAETTLGIASTLVRYRRLPSTSGALQGPTAVIGELASSWQKGPDGSYTFVLRNAKSPFGNTVTSADVKWTFDRAISLDFIARFLLGVGGIDTKDPVQIINDRTFRLRGTGAGSNTLSLAMLAWYGLGILDSTEAKKHATATDPWAKNWLNSNSASFGAYQISSFTPSVEVRLAANPNYWNRRNVNIRQVVMRAVPDAGARLLLVQSGSVDFVSSLGYDLFKSVVKSPPKGVKTLSAIDTNLDKFSLNTTVAPFTDVRVRKAIALAIDRRALVQGAYGGFGKAAVGPISSAIPQPKLPAGEALQYNQAQAKALLAQAGFPAGFSFTLTINPTSGPGPQATAVATLIQSQLAKIGVTVNIVTIAAPAEFSAATLGKKLPAWLFGTRPLVNDPAYFLSLAVGKNASKLEGWSDPRVDRLTDLMVLTPPGKRRNRQIASARKILAAGVAYVPLVETVIPWVYRDTLSGLAPNPTGAPYPQDLKKR